MENIIQRLTIIDSIIEENDFGKTDFIMESLSRPAESNYLFNKVESNFKEEWFIYLYELDAFNFASIPKVKEELTEDGNVNHWFSGWDASPLIKKCAEFNLTKKDVRLKKILLELINSYIQYVREKAVGTARNSRPDWFFCDYILLLPLEDISQEHFSFILDYGLGEQLADVSEDLTTTFFDRVISQKNKKKLLELLNIFYSTKQKKEVHSFNLRSNIKDYALREFVNTSTRKLFSLLNIDIFEWLEKRIESLAEKYPLAFSKLSLVSVAEDKQNWHKEGLNNHIVIHLRNCFEIELLPKFLTEITFSLISKKTAVLKRIGLYVINKNFALLENLFWEMGNPLLDIECKLETFKLIQNQAPKLRRDNIGLITKWIEEIPLVEGEKYSDEEKSKHRAYQQLEWYIALEKINPKYLDLTYPRSLELKEKIGTYPSHPGYDSWFETRVGGGYSLKRISDQNIRSIPDRLNNEEYWDGYDQWGLQEDFRSLIGNRTEEVIDNINLFFKIKSNFLYYFFDAFRNIFTEKKTLDWKRFLEFTKKLLLERQELWDFTGPYANDNSTSLGMIAWLIKDGVNLNNPVFVDNEQHDLLIEILKLIDERYSKEFEKLNKEEQISFDILNSTRGKLYDAMLSLSVLIAKNKSTSEERWDLRIKAVFDNRLKDGSYFEEFYWTTGIYTAQIVYLDKNWWLNNRQLIFINNRKIKDSAFKGYLSFSSQLYRDVFNYLLEFYDKAIEIYQSENIYTEHLVQHIVIAFQIDEEKSQDLISKVFAIGNLFHLKYMVDYIQGRYIILNSEKLLFIWEQIVEIGYSSQKLFGKKVIFGTAYFLEFFEKIDYHILQLFEKSIENYSPDPRIYRLTEFSKDHIKSNPKIWGKIFKLLTDKIEGYYSYGKETVISGIEELYRQEDYDTANAIAIHLAEQGNYYVKDLYNKYNNVTQS